MIFDTHTHLNVSAFEGEEKKSSRVQKELAVTRFAVVGFDTDTITRSLELSEEFKEVVSIIGWHPTEAYRYNIEIEEWLQERLTHPQVVAMGKWVWIIIGKIQRPRNKIRCSVAKSRLLKK